MNIVVENENESESDVNATVTVTVTVALVKRVSDRLAMGIPLDLALAGEPVTREDYEEQLREHPKLADLQDEAKREFLEKAMKLLFNGKNSSANIRWWLERVYPEIFAKRKSEEEEEAPKEIQTIRGIPEELLEEARRQAMEVESAAVEQKWRFKNEDE